MIVRSRFIRLYELSAHLQSEANEEVVVRHNLHRHAPTDLSMAIRAFVALSRTNLRMTRELLHIKVSPAHECSEIELIQSIQTTESEHKIPVSIPRIVVAHVKGDRARHFHLVYPTINPEDGRAIDSSRNYLKDEIASRRLELAFAEPITPGPRQKGVINSLRERGFDSEASALAETRAAQRGRRVGDAARQGTSRLGIDAIALGSKISVAWHASAGDDPLLERLLANDGLRLANGDKAVLIVDDASGSALPLARTLRQVAKSNDAPFEIRERDLRDRFRHAPPFGAARDTGLAEMRLKATEAAHRELSIIIFESEQDGEDALALRLKKVRARLRREAARDTAKTLKAKRAEIARRFRQRDALRRRRIDRAFNAARWLDNPRFRETAMMIAGGAVLLAGGGLGLAFLAAGLSAGLMPSFERARAIARYEQMRRITDREERSLAIRNLEEVKPILENTGQHAKVDFASIRKEDRILVGALARATLEGMDQRDDSNLAELTDQIRRSLSAAQADGVQKCVQEGSGRAALRMMSWFNPDKPAHTRALRAALHRKTLTRSSRPKVKDIGGHGIER